MKNIENLEKDFEELKNSFDAFKDETYGTMSYLMSYDKEETIENINEIKNNMTELESNLNELNNTVQSIVSILRNFNYNI